MKALILISTICLGSLVANAGYEAATLRGVLVEKVVAVGSKSERKVLAVQTSGQDAIPVRSKNSNPFQIDEQLARFLGRTVQCTGVLSNGQLLNVICERLD